MSSSFLAIFIRLKEQSFDSALELDSESVILSKPFPAPDGRWASEALFSSESVQKVLCSAEVKATCGVLNPSVMSNQVWAESCHSNWSVKR